MTFIQTGEGGRVVGWTEAEDNPDPGLWLDSPWEEVPDDFDDWLYDGQELAYSPRTDRPVPELTLDDLVDAVMELGKLVGGE